MSALPEPHASCPKSQAAFEAAQEVMPGGNTRHTLSMTPFPLYAKSAKGAYITDVDGHARLDTLSNFCSLIAGHAIPEVVTAVSEQMARGSAFGMPTTNEIDLAKLLVDRIPYIDSVRFCNSGTEGVLYAVKAARAVTKRNIVAKFEGCYHGGYDYVECSESPASADWGAADKPTTVAGDEGNVSANMLTDVLVLPWNDPEGCEALIAQAAVDLACVVVCPLATITMWLSAPKPGFLARVFKAAEKAGALYVADEVLSFSCAFNGAHAQVYAEEGVYPHLTALGKVIGGGLPVGAVGGRAEIMKQVFCLQPGQSGTLVRHGGTFNGNPLTMAAGFALMQLLTADSFVHLEKLRAHVEAKLVVGCKALGFDMHLSGRGRLFVVVLGRSKDQPLTNYREVVQHGEWLGWAQAAPFICQRMLSQGILFSLRAPFAALQTPMTLADMDKYASAFLSALAEARDAGLMQNLFGK